MIAEVRAPWREGALGFQSQLPQWAAAKMALSVEIMAGAIAGSVSVTPGPPRAEAARNVYAVCGVIFEAPGRPAAYSQIVRLTFPRNRAALLADESMDAAFAALLRDAEIRQHRSKCFLSPSAAGVQVERAAWERQVNRPILARVEIKYKFIWPPILDALGVEAGSEPAGGAVEQGSSGFHAVVVGSIEAGMPSVGFTQIRSH